MSRIISRYARRGGSTTVRIKGKTVDINLAKLVYRCAECVQAGQPGQLKREGFGLVCAAGCKMKDFIHRDEARDIESTIRNGEGSVAEFYYIDDDRIEFREDNDEC